MYKKYIQKNVQKNVQKKLQKNVFKIFIFNDALSDEIFLAAEWS